MSARKKLTSSASVGVSRVASSASSASASASSVAVGSSATGAGGTARSTAPVGRLTGILKTTLASNRVALSNELLLVITKLFPDADQSKLISELQGKDGNPFFTVKNKRILMEIKAIERKFGFEVAYEFCKNIENVGEVIKQTPLLESVREQLQIDDEMVEKGGETISENSYTCIKAGCNNKKIGFFMKQTRSGDEGATTFLRCTVCGKRWSERG